MSIAAPATPSLSSGSGAITGAAGGSQGVFDGTPTITVNSGASLVLTLAAISDELGYTPGKDALVINDGTVADNTAHASNPRKHPHHDRWNARWHQRRRRQYWRLQLAGFTQPGRHFGRLGQCGNDQRENQLAGCCCHLQRHPRRGRIGYKPPT